MSAHLWEGSRRLPYFFSYGQPDGEGRRAVLCPQCVLVHVEKEPQYVQAHFHISRSVMCGACGILIGPINEEETSG